MIPSSPMRQACANASEPSALCAHSGPASARQELRQSRLAGAERQRPEILTIQFQQVECVQESLTEASATVEFGACVAARRLVEAVFA